MDYSFFALNSLFFPSMYQGVPYIDSKGVMKGWIRAISRNREGQESNETDPCQGKLQKYLDYAHIPMYAVLGVNPRIYAIRGLKIMCIVFHMLLGMIKETSKDKKWSIGAKDFAAGQGKAIQSVIHLEWWNPL